MDIVWNINFDNNRHLFQQSLLSQFTVFGLSRHTNDVRHFDTIAIDASNLLLKELSTLGVKSLSRKKAELWSSSRAYLRIVNAFWELDVNVEFTLNILNL